MRHFHTKLICKSILRQTEWEVQNGPVTKNGVLTSNYFIFSKLVFQFKNLA